MPADELPDANKLNDLQQLLDLQGIPLHLFAGHEALIKSGMVEDIQAGRLATLNKSRYLLLELWNNTWLPETERVIFELRTFGVIPIIAHPERYRARPAAVVKNEEVSVVSTREFRQERGMRR
jgi:protein-tyrosine phosphatase